MAPDDWLRAVALNLRAGAGASARFLTLAPRLRTDFPESAFTPATAQDVCEGLDALPAYADLRNRLQALGPFQQPMRRDQEDNQTDAWRTYLRQRLGAGGDPAHLLSLAKTHVPDSGKERLIHDLFPDAWRREQSRRAEVARDKAKGLVRRVSVALKRVEDHGPTHTPPDPPTRPRPQEKYLPREAFEAWQRRVGQ